MACTIVGSYPTFSMTSISPHAGQPTWPMSAPSIQNAGQMPCPRGILMRASTRPYCAVKVPSVFSRAEVKVPSGSRIAVIASCPEPFRALFRRESV